MSPPPRVYVEHVAIHVKDIHWHIAFFRDVLGLTLRDLHGTPEAPSQVWTYGSVQFIYRPEYDGFNGRLNHLGLMAEDAEAVIAAALAYPGVSHDERGRNWLVMPDGLVLEILAASPGAVAQALAVNPRA